MPSASSPSAPAFRRSTTTGKSFAGPNATTGSSSTASRKHKEGVHMSRYDVIVVGAGNGGLTAAVTCAKAGYKVLLLEKHNLPGGCATSVVRGRFEF
ncbi:MAG: NAD(P)-binding protein, partial [Clostridia bacterium]|nr:NAD(P)-binding protein [Clostridia bacterium]